MRSRKAIMNIISSVILQIITIICGFIVPKLILQTYGSAVNGLLQSITQFLAYIALLESGFGPVVKALLYKPIANKDKDTIARILKTSQNFFRKISYIFIIYILVLCVVLPMATSHEFDTGFTISLLIIIATSTFAEYFFGMTFKIYIGAEQKQYISSFFQIATILLNTVLMIILIKLGTNIQVVKLASALAFVLRPLLQYVYVKKKYKINLRNVKGDYPIKQKWDGLAQHVAYVLHKNTDIVIITLCADIKEASVYSIYYLVINSVKNVVHAFIEGIDATFGDMNAKGEQENLTKSFRMYEALYFAATTIIFACTAVLTVPFVSIYTQGITDANYFRPEFLYIIAIAEFFYMIRMPYFIALVKSTGRFKETKIGAWVEAGINVVLSIILIWKFGLVGIAIGTLVAMIIRTIEIMCFSAKIILKVSVWHVFKILFVITLEFIVIVAIMQILPEAIMTNYLEWFLQALKTFGISLVIVVPINLLVFRKDVKNIKYTIKSMINDRKNKEIKRIKQGRKIPILFFYF